ncbi:MAG: hypothetical protein QW407_04775 [Thermofilaceae archaeon]
MRSLRSLRSSAPVSPQLFWLIARLNARYCLLNPVNALGRLISLTLQAAILTQVWGLNFGRSFAVASVITGAVGVSYPRPLPPFSHSLLAEAPLNPRYIKRLNVSARTLLAIAIGFPSTLLLVAPLVYVGLLPASAMTIRFITVAAIIPIFSQQTIFSLLIFQIPELLIRWLRIPTGIGPPAHPMELAAELIRVVWRDCVFVIVGALTPVYFPLASLPPYLQAVAILFNPYALSIELARSTILGTPAPAWVAPAAFIIAAAWFIFNIVYPME